MKKSLEYVKNIFDDMSRYKLIFIFIGSVFILEWLFISELYLSSWESLYVCLMLFVVDIKRTFWGKIIMSLFCFFILVLFSWFIYCVFVENHENTDKLLDTVLSLLIPFVFYFIDYFCMRSKVKEIQKYEDEKIKKRNNKTI